MNFHGAHTRNISLSSGQDPLEDSSQQPEMGGAVRGRGTGAEGGTRWADRRASRQEEQRCAREGGRAGVTCRWGCVG
jgi:hypothetical protein